MDPEPIIDTTPRPTISTKYKSSSSPLPPATHLRRTQTDTAAILPPRPSSNGSKKRKMMRVEYPFDAESDSEMSIVPGEIVAVIEEVDAGWFIGEVVGSEFRQGMFPATYCVVIPTESAGSVPGVRRTTTLKPPSPSSLKSEDSLDDQVAGLSLRRPATVGATRPGIAGRSVSTSGSPAGKKKAPPPPVSRGSKPGLTTTTTTGSAASSVAGEVRCRECGCDEFRANVFKKGSCNNCFHVHVAQ
jgi:SH3 domain